MKMKVRKLQIARRTVQWLVVVLILLIPALARYNNYLSARELDRTLERMEGTLQGAVLQAIDTTLRRLPHGEEQRTDGDAYSVRNREQVLIYAQGLRGGPWSMEIGPLSMTDPVAVAESLAAGKRSSRVLWIGLIIPLAATLLLGKIYCSWICPVGLLTELTDKLRRPLRWLEIRPADVPLWRGTKFALLGTGLLLAAILSYPILGALYPPAMVGRELHDLVFGMFDRAELGRPGFSLAGLTWMSLVLGGIVLVEIFVSRRWWCRYLCPGGALYALIGRWRGVRIVRRVNACTDCGDCDTSCHLGLKPMTDQLGQECDNCGLCISHCGDDAIGYKWQIGEKG